MAKGRKTVKTTPEAPRAREARPAPNGGATSDVVETVRGLAAVVAEHALSELVYDTPDVTITIRRGGIGMPVVAQVAGMPVPPMAMTPPIAMPPPMAMPAPIGPGPAPAPAAPAAAAPAEDKGHVVTSPFVGTFYRRPNPDSPVYVNVNDKVEKGTVLCIVEAMKLMNEIEADIAGTITGILAEDGAPVEYGQPLFKIMPA